MHTPDGHRRPRTCGVYVADVADVFDRALAAGARAVTRPTELPFGERVARLRDPQGHLWWVHQRLEDVDPGELARRFADQSAKEAMAYVQQSLSNELSGAG
jgi:PhnB protein